jgi:hypothetical protein
VVALLSPDVLQEYGMPGSGYFSTAQFDSMVDIVTGRRFVLRLVIELAALSIGQI